MDGFFFKETFLLLKKALGGETKRFIKEGPVQMTYFFLYFFFEFYLLFIFTWITELNQEIYVRENYEWTKIHAVY